MKPYHYNIPLIVIQSFLTLGPTTGQFTEKIFLKFNCNVYAFEPVKNFVDILNNKFENHQKVKILKFGLLDENKDIKISSIGAGSSIFC